ncbi:MULTISPECIES: flagellar biosynthetic protein FliO [Dehalobacter]|jgi:flagellar protein FliO/FliZ|uniref:Flagellar biosynthesis protein FliO n=2 Tax=Dehalobacter restrictus TaxID=55583 RepID=A0A857DKA7_9FIRM|nr:MULTISPECIES: flagellar biosynthetic protein FliO [Dehalobacter]AHF10610.1 flagellar biosynthetic protein FliO [Dehalobacter restrictus DSM 9455]MCG1026421.1 flagellar biosynthetic protein FliO [Dehalobacter sp.]MDJ0305994.1 flagellar biosynthetic protein FliO [Dehalobacter sp.]OCZ52355.1 flagellar biosynthesis protein FliO [Dehalobacter sp. TeCB1]QHA01233.1 flagellar biosynthesis protein FliO [Dehalobacter restrictus]
MNDYDKLPYPGASGAAGSAVTPTEAFSWPGLIGMIVVFLIILVVALWLIKRLNRFSMRSIQSPWVRVLDRQVLNGQQALYLVEIAGKIQVLGGTDHHITKVAEIDDLDVAAEILDEIARQPQEKMDEWMSVIWKKLKKKQKNEPFSAELERFLKEEKNEHYT